jgi:hypothetical protein
MKTAKSKKQIPKDIRNSMKSNAYLLGLVAVFAGFSLYAVFSFSGSTSNYINGKYASVLNAGDGMATVTEDLSYEVFSDVRSSTPHAVAIEKLRDLGVFGGYPDGTFKPDKVATRAETLSVLATAVDVDFAGASYGNCFTDIKNEWFAVPVCYAKKQGWVNGLKDGRFLPNEGVNYPEALKTTITVFGFEVPAKVEVEPITGVKVTAWYAPYFQTAINYGLIDADFVFNGSHQLTRGEFAELVYQAMKAKKLF